MQVDRFRYMFPVIAFEHSGDLFGLLSWGIKSDKSDKEFKVCLRMSRGIATVPR